MRYSLKIALSSVLGAAAIMISISFHGVPYPIAPFLKIDFSEIIDLVALFAGGWWVGLAVATIHFLGLMINTEFIIGPPLKYLAVLSMYLGILICNKILRIQLNINGVKNLVAVLISSSFIRALAMIMINILVLLYVAPEFYIFFKNQLASLTGVDPGEMDVFIYVGYIIGSYNIVQTLLAIIPAYIVMNIINRHLGINPNQ